MSIKLSDALTAQRLTSIASAVDASGAGKLTIYGGARPLVPGFAPTGPILAVLTMHSPSFGPVANGSITALPITSAVASGTGTATWFRITSGSGLFVLDGEVGTVGADMLMLTTDIVAGITLSVSSLVITDHN